MPAKKEEEKGFNIGAIQEEGTYLFMEDVTESSCKSAIEFILAHNLSKKDKPKSLRLVINSPGGSCDACFGLIDVMKGSQLPIHTVGIGCIASCGILLFMSGEPGHRILTPNTAILSHQYSWVAWGKEHELLAATVEHKNLQKKMIKHYKKCTGLSKKDIRKYLLPAHDVWLTPKKAIKYGIADEIKKLY